jgi:hypothetical protein
VTGEKGRKGGREGWYKKRERKKTENRRRNEACNKIQTKATI